MSLRFWSALWLALLFAVLPVYGFAQSEKEQAAAAFKQGREFFTAERYAEALASFKKANELAPHPVMIFNIAQVYEAMGDFENAVAQLKVFTTTSPKVTDEQREKLAALEKLLASYVSIEVRSDPPGAQVDVGKGWEPRGVTPLTFKLPKGKHTLHVSKDEYQATDRVIRADSSSLQVQVALQAMAPTVAIDSEPSGADVYVLAAGEERTDDTPSLGQTPISIARPAGKYTVELYLQGYRRTSNEIELLPTHTPPEAPLTLSQKLEVAPPTGFLKMYVNYGGIEVFIDGNSVGVTPIEKAIELDAGARTITMTGPDGKLYTETRVIEGGATVKTNIELKAPEKKGMPGHEIAAWTLWGVGGASLITGSVMGFLALQSDGDLSDCRDNPNCARTSKESDYADDVRSHALMADIFIGAGAALAITGTLLYILIDDDNSASANVSLMPIPGGMGATAGFRF